VALGRADIARSATVSGFQNPPAATSPPTPCGPPQSPNCVPFSLSEAQAKNGAFIFGWSLGGGLEIMLMPKAFLRAEYEYIAFSPWGSANTVEGIKTSIQTARMGVGYKF
jgi:opacity protein-like surface antigen